MTHSKPDDKSVLLVHAYLDGELDPANALGITQQMDKEPALAAEAERVKALQQLIHERLPREATPPGLRGRIEASVGGLRKDRGRLSSWRALAASIAVTAIVTSTSTWLVVQSQQQPTMVADALVSDHIRALMAPEPVDVVSSDRHTVKPWFNGRITASPRVVDLTKEDFPLIGGRIEVVDHASCFDVGLSPRQAPHQPHRGARRKPVRAGADAARRQRLQHRALGRKRRELLGNLRS